MANVLTVVAKLSAKSGKGDELATILREQVAAVLKAEPDCLVYRLHRSKKHPDLFKSTAFFPFTNFPSIARTSRHCRLRAIGSKKRG